MAVNWGIISTARINDNFLAGARASVDAEVVAVASRDQERAQTYARDHGIPRAYGSYEALLADPEIDVVYVSLPNSLHVEWTLHALAAGKHVLCEKPLSRRPADVAVAFDAAEQAGLVLMEAFMYRHNPQSVRLKELVESGSIGAVRMIRAELSFLARDPSDVRLNGALDGGALMDLGCYCVSGSRLIAGEPERVTAEQVLGGAGVDVAFAATMRFPGDILAHFDAGLSLSRRHELQVVGDDGVLFLADPWTCKSPVIELRREGSVERIEIAPADSFACEVDNMCAAVRGLATPLLGRSDALGQARAIEALYEAAASGCAVSL